MDKDHAKFILHSYRPDGADANDSDFTEALQLAAKDRALGEWLANERANDAVFSVALKTIDIPDRLREEILAVLEHDQRADSSLESDADFDADFDAVFFGAVAGIQSPTGLRDEILSAMEVEFQLDKPESMNSPRKWIRFGWMAAIAATIIFGVVSLNSLPVRNGPQLEVVNAQVQTGKFINVSKEIEYDHDTLEGVNLWLEGKGLPKADTIPNGLIQTQTKGGRKIVFDNGLEASVIVFEKEDVGDFYLMILEDESVLAIDEIVKLGEVSLNKCWSCPVTYFNATSWRDDNKVYVLLTKSLEQHLIELF